MGHVVRTPAGTYRANWRNEMGKQKAKSFPTKKAATAFLAHIENSVNQGTYVDPHAGRQAFGPYATRWLASRSTERTTTARDISVMRTNVMPRWAEVPIGRIDHLTVQTWVSELTERLSPATVTVCLRLLSNVLRSAMRDRIIGANPCEGVRVPKRRRRDTDGITISPTVLRDQLLPAIPEQYRALVALAGGTGMRWGECVGIRWNAVDLNAHEVRVIRTMVEVSGNVSMKPFPKSSAGRRTIPLPSFVAAQLRRHHAAYGAGQAGEVFRNSAGGPLRRTLFRSRIWRPALVRAGLLGAISPQDDNAFEASWSDDTGIVHRRTFRTERDAVGHVAREAAGGLRFHDLRHSYATWLVSQGLPVNDVQRVMGHERASTTLDLYTHRSKHGDDAVRDAFADDSLTVDPETGDTDPAAHTETDEDRGDTPAA